MPVASVSWTQDRVEQLRSLWAQGLSAAQIARRMGGITRNAVMGKADRLGLQPRKNGVKRATTGYRPAKRAKPVTAPKPALVQPEPRGALNTLLGAGLCKFIHGDPMEPNWRMCGHETGSITKSWCGFHHDLCSSPARIAADNRADSRTADVSQDRMMRRMGLG